MAEASGRGGDTTTAADSSLPAAVEPPSIIPEPVVNEEERGSSPDDDNRGDDGGDDNDGDDGGDDNGDDGGDDNGDDGGDDGGGGGDGPDYGEPVTVTLGPDDLEDSVSARNLPLEKMRGGTWVARALVTTFAASVLVWFFIAALIIGVSSSPAQAEQFAKTLVPFLKEYASFATAVFSPLLAFVLGYYFSEKEHK